MSAASLALWLRARTTRKRVVLLAVARTPVLQLADRAGRGRSAAVDSTELLVASWA